MKDWDAGFWGSYVAHAHLNGGEDAEVVLGEVAQGVHVELHGVLPLLLQPAEATGQWGGGRRLGQLLALARRGPSRLWP